MVTNKWLAIRKRKRSKKTKRKKQIVTPVQAIAIFTTYGIRRLSVWLHTNCILYKKHFDVRCTYSGLHNDIFIQKRKNTKIRRKQNGTFYFSFNLFFPRLSIIFIYVSEMGFGMCVCV